jgi:hypothetical protein
MSQPSPQEIATQLEAYRISLASRDHTINILIADLAQANVALNEATQKLESSKSV